MRTVLGVALGVLAGVIVTFGLIFSWLSADGADPTQAMGWSMIFAVFICPFAAVWFAGTLLAFDLVGQAIGQRAVGVIGGSTLTPLAMLGLPMLGGMSHLKPRGLSELMGAAATIPPAGILNVALPGLAASIVYLLVARDPQPMPLLAAAPAPVQPAAPPPQAAPRPEWLERLISLCDPHATLDIETFKRNGAHVLIVSIALWALDLIAFRSLPIELVTMWMTYCLFAGRLRALSYGAVWAAVPLVFTALFYLLTHALDGDVSPAAVFHFVKSTWPAVYFTLGLALVQLGDSARRAT